MNEEFEAEFTCPLKARDPMESCRSGSAIEVSGHVYQDHLQDRLTPGAYGRQLASDSGVLRKAAKLMIGETEYDVVGRELDRVATSLLVTADQLGVLARAEYAGLVEMRRARERKDDR